MQTCIGPWMFACINSCVEKLFFAQMRQKLTQICTKMNNGHNQHFVFALDSDFDLTSHLRSAAYDKKWHYWTKWHIPLKVYPKTLPIYLGILKHFQFIGVSKDTFNLNKKT